MRVNDYWNNINIEKSKPHYILDKSDYQLLYYLQKDTNLQRCFNDAISFANTIGGLKGNILDVGAGTCWTSAIVSKIPAVKNVLASDFSKHRLTKMAPIVFEQFQGDVSKFSTVLGDFMDLDLKSGSFDVIIFCQSLYMFTNLQKTLAKVNRLLVMGGILVVACERIMPNCPFYTLHFFKKKLKRLIKLRTDLSGNQGYADYEYRNAIKAQGLDYRFQSLDYSLFPKTNDLLSGNHFGVKVR